MKHRLELQLADIKAEMESHSREVADVAELGNRAGDPRSQGQLVNEETVEAQGGGSVEQVKSAAIVGRQASGHLWATSALPMFTNEKPTLDVDDLAKHCKQGFPEV
jgi:hypothetical protein